MKSVNLSHQLNIVSAKNQLVLSVWQAVQKIGLAGGNFLKNIDWFWENLRGDNFSYGVSLPVGDLDPGVMELIGAKERTVWLRDITFGKIRGWRADEGFTPHPEITREYFWAFPYVLFYPQHVIASPSETGRYLLVGRLGKLFTIVVEIGVDQGNNWLVTAFMARGRYLQKREDKCLLHQRSGDPAGTAVPPILAPPKANGGSRFSTLQDPQSFYTKLEQESQGAFRLSYGGIGIDALGLDHPSQPEHGDYSTNVAMKLAAELDKNPREIAQKIVDAIEKPDFIEKIEVAGPGFINFWLSSNWLIAQSIKMASEQGLQRTVLRNGSMEGQRVVVEFGQPNTHKLPHVGHLRSYAIGESLARILEYTGHNVFRANYQGDVGLHVAKCLWGYKKRLKVKGDRLKMEGLSLKERVRILQESYQYGSKMYQADEGVKEEIDRLNRKIYRRDPQVYKLWKETRQWSLDYYELLNRRLGTKYHRVYLESEAAEAGKQLVKKHVGRVFQKSQGAIIFPGVKYGLHNRVFITSVGNPTYEAKDLALIFLKKKDFDYERSLIATGADQKEYFKVVYKAARQIAPELARAFVHIPFGLVTLKGGKMSSREGTIVSIDELLENVRIAASELGTGKILAIVTIGAAKYSLLKYSTERDITFDIGESVALEGNSGPYLQYTYARCRSVLREARGQGVSDEIDVDELNPEELEVLRTLYQFGEVLEAAALEFAPNKICDFLFDLAQKYNRLYQKHRILQAPEGKRVRQLRLVLTTASARIIKTGLWLLGIRAPERM